MDNSALPHRSHPAPSAAASSSDPAVWLYETVAPAAREQLLVRLVGEVFESAPLAMRARLIETLLRPLGVLALAGIAGGVFARMRLGAGWQGTRLRLEDVKNVRTIDVLALAERVQQASHTALHELGLVVAASPMLTGSAAATVLLMLSLRSAKDRSCDDFDA